MSYSNSPPLPFSFIFPSPNSWNTFNKYHLFLHLHTCVHIFSPTYPSPHHFPPPNAAISPLQGRTCSAFLFSNVVKKKKKKDEKKK
jgi:hypothetical protein